MQQLWMGNATVPKLLMHNGHATGNQKTNNHSSQCINCGFQISVPTNLFAQIAVEGGYRVHWDIGHCKIYKRRANLYIPTDASSLELIADSTRPKRVSAESTIYPSRLRVTLDKYWHPQMLMLTGTTLKN